MTLLAVSAQFALTVAAPYSGKVFVDENRNGIYDTGEKRLAGICVSDGLHVVKTDRNGQFTLPGHNRERFIFITTPSGYKTHNNYYRRISESTTSYDFGLIPFPGQANQDGSHRFIHISDTEIGEEVGHDEWVENLRRYSAGENVAFIVHTGDICYTAGLNSHIRLMNTANMDTPVFYCIGNHDLVQGKYGEEVFENNYGPVYYSFDVGSTHYIVTPMAGGDYRPAYTREDVCKWMKNDLEQQPAGKPVMVFNHDLLTMGDNFVYPGNDTLSLDLNKYNLKAWIYGHWHINYIRKHGNTFSVCTSTPVRGGIGHASSAFRVLNVDDQGDFSSELRYTYFDKKLKIASVAHQHHALTDEGRIPVSVNTYSTVSPTKGVTCTLLADGREITKAVSLQQQTDFNWRTEIELPHRYANRLITMHVEATYRNGEKAQEEQSFFYQPQPETRCNPANREWTNLLGNASHLGIARDTLQLPLRLCWTTQAGSNIYLTSPIVKDGRLYVATVDEDEKGRAAVVCLDANNGKHIWKYNVEGSIRNTIALESGNVFAQDVHGNLYALSAATGQLAWKKRLQVYVLPELMDGLATANGVVYAGSGYGLCALDAKTGREIWRNKSWGQSQGCTATLSVGSGVIIGNAHWGALYANDMHTGKYLWGRSENGIRHRSASPAIKDGLLYFISGESVFVMTAMTGEVVMQRNLGYNVDVASTPLVTDKEIIFGTAQRGIVVLDRTTLAERWNFQTGEALIYSSPYTRNPSSTIETSPVLSGNTVFVAASDGGIYGLDRSNGRMLWRYLTGVPCFGSVAIVGNALYAVDFGGNVYGFAGNK